MEMKMTVRVLELERRASFVSSTTQAEQPAASWQVPSRYCLL
jgi:hypothetical protein